MTQPAPCWSTIVKNPPPPPSAAAALPEKGYVESCKSSKGVAVAVVDANAVIHGGDGLAGASERFVTVTEVYEEIRDPVSRHRLSVVPFSIDCREPSPQALKKVINFARATGDLQTLSDVDLKLIALTYTLEAQIHGTSHLRETPPPIHTVNVKRLPEKDLPGWGSNVPNLEEWEALEDQPEQISDSNTKILPLQDLNLNTIPSNDRPVTEEGSTKIEGESPVSNQEDTEGSFRKPKNFLPKKKEVNIEGKIVVDGVDASQGKFDDNDGDFQPAVSRSTRRRYYKRQARRQSEALSETDSQQDVSEVRESDNLQHSENEITEGKKETEVEGNEDLSEILDQMRLEEETLGANEEEDEKGNPCEEAMEDNDLSVDLEGEENENINGGLESLEIPSETNESLDVSCVDDKSSEQSWRLRSLSESSVACVTSDFAMQNVLLQMGLRLLAPGGMQIRELHRWILKCHACFKVTTEIGRIFCPSCGNGGTLRKVAVTVGENGIVISARRMRVSVRGTRFSLPRPQGGREAITKNPVLREDQLPQKFLHPKLKKKNKDGDDLFSSDDLFHHHSTDKKAPLRPPVRKALAVFSGKRNPNDNHYSRSSH